MLEIPLKPVVVLVSGFQDRAFALRLQKGLKANSIYVVLSIQGHIGEKERRKADLGLAFLNNADAAFILVSTLMTTEDLHYFARLAKQADAIPIHMEEGYEKALSLITQNLETKGLSFGLPIRIDEDPLTVQNLNTILSALTDLSTKYWLITKMRFADLVEYTQTHNGHFAEEAQVVITRISYNSPFSMNWKVDLSAPSVAEALVITIDGISQRQERLEKAKLENQAKALEIKETEQKSEQENQMALLEQEKLRLELEQRRLEVLERQLEVQKKGIEYALEIAGKVVNTLHPHVDAATRVMVIQTLLPNIVQLQNGKGLELGFPTLPPDVEEIFDNTL